MACMLLLSCASSSKPKLTEDTKVNPTVNDFYVKVTEVEEIATRIDSQLRELEIQESQTTVARDIQHIPAYARNLAHAGFLLYRIFDFFVVL